MICALSGLAAIGVVGAVEIGAIQAARPVMIDIPPSSASAAMDMLARQTNVSIAIGVDLSSRRTPGLQGRMTVETALERLLRPLDLRAIPIASNAFRIEARPAGAPLQPETIWIEGVVVTAPAERGGLDGPNGRASIGEHGLRSAGLDPAGGGTSSAAISNLSSSVESTRQGPGRNKLFIRGLADSAFSGPLQATVGQYLGDLRLNYGSPDPDLALVDVRSLDVFAGPQGSRFGSGSIGGVIRIVPEPPNSEGVVVRTGSAVSVTKKGSAGADAFVVVNQPLGPQAAARIVGWARRDGGFVRNPGRGVNFDDDVHTRGVRASVRTTRSGWTTDGLVLWQTIQADDAQTVPVGTERLVSDRQVAEPYASDLALAGVTLNRRIPAGRLTLAASLSRQASRERFDDTPPAATWAAAVDRRHETSALSVEGRLQKNINTLLEINAGAAFVRGRTRADRGRRNPVTAVEPSETAGLERRFTDASIYGELIASPVSSIQAAFGGRISSITGVERLRRDGPGAMNADPRPRSQELAITPTAAFRWDVAPELQVFVRYEQGLRPGGTSESNGVVEVYRSDRVSVAEAGVRSLPSDHDWSAELSIGHVDWSDIQADRVSPGGDIVFGNIGDGEIAFLDAKAAWRPIAGLNLSGGVFLARSRLDVDGVGVIGVASGDIPNVAPFSARLSVDRDVLMFSSNMLTLGADLRHIGVSRPGLGPGLDTAQGGYLHAVLRARLALKSGDLVLSVSNPQNVSGTRFGLGSPYRLTEPHVAPIRPLTVRLGFETAF